MPIGAIVGSAVVGAGSSALAASKNSKAISKSTDAQTAANDKAIAAQEKARAENLALQAPIYNAGLPAMQARNALLGLGGTAPAPQGTQTLPTAQPNALAMYQGVNPDTSAGRIGMAGAVLSNDLAYNPRQTMGTGLGGQFGNIGGMDSSGFTLPGNITGYGSGTFNTNGTPVTVGTQGQPAPGQTGAQAAASAFDNFRNSTGYQFRLGEGMNALNSGWAGRGTLQSGAALKSALEYGQNYASGEFGNYMGYLGEQQNLASGAANAMSGVNTTYANNAGNLAVAQGQNLANSAVARANNSNALIGSIGSSIGGVIGGLGGMGGGGGGAYMYGRG